MGNNSLSLKLVLVLLLASMNLLRSLLPDNWLLGFWALVVDVLVLLVIVGEILVRWWLNRPRASVDEVVLDFLALPRLLCYSDLALGYCGISVS